MLAPSIEPGPPGTAPVQALLGAPSALLGGVDRALLDHLTLSAPFGVAILDPQMRFLRVSAEFERSLGVKAKELIGARVLDRFPDLEAGDFTACFERALAGQVVRAPVQRFADGSRAMHTATAFGPCRSCAGEIIAVAIVCIDLSREVDADTALQRSETQLEHLLTSVPSVIYSATPLPPYQRDYVSHNAQEVLGYSSDELLDQPELWLQAIHPDDRPGILETLAAQAPGSRLRYRYRWQHPDGFVRWIEEDAHLLDDEPGKPARRIGCSRDITAQHESERRALAQRRQQAALAALGRLALTGCPSAELVQEAVNAVAVGLGVPLAACWEVLPEHRLRLEAGLGWRAGTLEAAPLVLPEALRSSDFFVCHAERFASAELAAHGVGELMCSLVGDSLRPQRFLAALRTDARGFCEEEHHYLLSVAHVLSSALLRESEQRVRALLLEHIISSQDRERSWIARELHDTAGQSLTAVLVGLKSIEDAPTLPQARGGAARLRETAAGILGDLGRLARGLHPRALDDLGLVAAAERHTEVYARSCGLQSHFHEQGLVGVQLRPSVENALYRILQEALTNVARHARATTVWVELRRAADEIELTVKDDGRGFDCEDTFLTAAGLEHFGLHGMRERATLFGGTLHLESRPGLGTAVVARFPFGTRKSG